MAGCRSWADVLPDTNVPICKNPQEFWRLHVVSSNISQLDPTSVRKETGCKVYSLNKIFIFRHAIN